MNRIVNIGITEAVSSEIVSVAEAKTHLLIDHSNDDTYLGDLIKMCRAEIEGVCNISIQQKTIELIADWDCEQELPYGLVTAVTSVAIKQGTDWTAVDSTEYSIDGNMFSGPEGRLKITYTAKTPVNNNLKKVLLNLVAFRYENRGDSGTEMPKDLEGQMIQLMNLAWL